MWNKREYVIIYDILVNWIPFNFFTTNVNVIKERGCNSPQHQFPGGDCNSYHDPPSPWGSYHMLTFSLYR